jgi:predicted dinucleotide-binding enzyme
MNITILGTGVVGRTHAKKLVELGHIVYMGTQDPIKTMKQDKQDAMGNPPFPIWHKENQAVQLQTFSEAASKGDIIFEALHGEIAVEVLKSLEKELDGKILVDISNPLDFSKGFPPTLFVENTDSLGERIQNALPKTKIVKTFNTLTAALQVEPNLLAGADHNLFISGNDIDAKKKVMEIQKSYGWKNIIDLGDITTSRGTEMLMPFWLRLMSALKTPMFNYKIVQN